MWCLASEEADKQLFKVGLLLARPQGPVSLYTSNTMGLLLALPQRLISLYTSDTVSLGLINFPGCDNLHHGFILSLYSAFFFFFVRYLAFFFALFLLCFLFFKTPLMYTIYLDLNHLPAINTLLKLPSQLPPDSTFLSFLKRTSH